MNRGEEKYRPARDQRRGNRRSRHSRDDRDYRHADRSGYRRRRSDSRRRVDRSKSRSRKRSPSKSCSSAGDEGHIEAVTGDMFLGRRYIVISELGIGTFGKVFLCNDKKHDDKVAIKVIRRIPKYVESAEIEADILKDVYNRQKSSGVHYFVKMYSTFRGNGHYCMVFEPLGVSIYDVINKNKNVGFPLALVRDITRQLLEAVGFLVTMNLIHTDLKLENVLFKAGQLVPAVSDKKGSEGQKIFLPSDSTIKIIDFGGATYEDEHKTTIVNTRQYRGPEVTLELGWSFPSDVWSVGCIVGEHDDLEHLCLMEKMVGPFPREAVQASPHFRKFFHRSGAARTEALTPSNLTFVQESKTLEETFALNEGDVSSGVIELMRGLLDLDANQRLTASQALECSFVVKGE